MSSKKLAQTQKRVLRQHRNAANQARAAAGAAGAAAAAGDAPAKPLTANSVHTHAKQPTHSHKSFREFLDRQPVLCERTDSQNAYRMADYCTQSLATLSSVLSVLNDGDADGNSSALSDYENARLRMLRDEWRAHLVANAYTLWSPPPGAGGIVMKYSLAIHLWLMIAHVNVLLQLCRKTGDLYDFYPPAHDYLVRNQLVVDNARVMQYPLRTLMLALENFVARLDTLDRFEPTYAKFAVALEHRLSELLCLCGTADEYNAHEWCLPASQQQTAPAAAAPAAGGGSVAGPAPAALLCITGAFLQYTFVYLMTITWYAERYEAVHRVRVLRQGEISTQPFSTVVCRVPMHTVLDSDWMPSMRSIGRSLDFVCNYAHGLVDDNYGRSLRNFLLEFELRPCDLDLYRLLENNNGAFARSALEFELTNANAMARTYVNRVFYDRTPYSYVQDYMQWSIGDEFTTRSAALDTQGFVRQLAILFLIDQFLSSKYRVRWRERFVLFHRDSGFATQLERSRVFPYPIIVQQFGRFSVLVPHRRAPEHDIRLALYWRAQVRARQTASQLSTSPPYLPPADEHYRQHCRAYDAPTFIDAFAIWSLWFLVLNNGAVDAATSMRDFLLELFGWD